MRLLHTLVLFVLSFPALAFDSEPPTTTRTTWEIYGVVVAFLVVGFIWVYFQQKKDRERQQRRRDAGRS